MHGGKQIANQHFIVTHFGGQTQFGAHPPPIGMPIQRHKIIQRTHQIRFGHQWQKRRRQTRQIPLENIRLLFIGIAPAVIGMIGHIMLRKAVHKTKRAVVDTQPQQRHIVGIEYAMGKAHALPTRHQLGTAAHNGIKQRQIRRFGTRAFGIMVAQQKIGQGLDVFVAAAVVKILKVAEAQKAGRDACYHRRGFGGFAVNRIVAGCQCQRARSGNAQPMHGFGTQIFTNAGTQHRTAIGKARIRRFTRALKLPFPTPPGSINRITQQHGAAIAQLRYIHTKLMAAVHRGQRRLRILFEAA